MIFARFDVYVVELEPTIGSEIRKRRPCVIISPDQMNDSLNTVIIAPLTTSARSYPFRVPSEFQGTPGRVALDQIRTVDKTRLRKRLGAVTAPEANAVLKALVSMFTAGDPE